MPTTHLTDKSFESLAKALCCWLDFQIHCGREQLLSESFMTQPIGDFLMAHYSGYLKPEDDHPQFKQAKPGRPKQLDYVLLSREQRLMDFAVECKWTGSTQPTRQSIVDDVMRLECLRRPAGIQGACARFFIVAGGKATVSKVLDGRINGTGQNPAPGFLSGYVPTQSSPKLNKVVVKACPVHYRKYFREFSTGYKLDLPNSYRARLVADEAGDAVRVLIWRIASMGKRTTFKHGTTW